MRAVRNLNYSNEVILQKVDGYFINRQYFIAAKYFDKAINLNISDVDVYEDYATAFFKLWNYDLAIKIDENFITPYVCAASLYYDRNNFQEAKKVFKSIENKFE